MKWRHIIYLIYLKVQNNGHKCAHQDQENNAWTKWEFQQRSRKYKKESNISHTVEYYNNWTKKNSIEDSMADYMKWKKLVEQTQRQGSLSHPVGRAKEKTAKKELEDSLRKIPVYQPADQHLHY